MQGPRTGRGRPCVVAAFILLLGTAICEGQVTAVIAGTVIHPETGKEEANQTILIEAGKIKAIGRDLEIPKDAVRVDLSREAVLPGLIDAHTHLLATVDAKWDLGDFWIMALQRRAGWRAIQGAQHAREMLESGFTTVRDVGNAGDYLDADLEKAIRFGVVPGPTMVFAGRIIAPVWRSVLGYADRWEAPRQPGVSLCGFAR